jgi:hypothetical protein
VVLKLSDTVTPLGNVRQLAKSAVLHIAAGSVSGCLVAAGTRIVVLSASAGSCKMFLYSHKNNSQNDSLAAATF